MAIGWNTPSTRFYNKRNSAVSNIHKNEQGVMSLLEGCAERK